MARSRHRASDKWVSCVAWVSREASCFLPTPLEPSMSRWARRESVGAREG